MDDNRAGRSSCAENRKAQYVSRGLDITRQRQDLILKECERAVQMIDKHNPDGSPAGTLVKIRIPGYEPAVYTR